MLIVPPRAHRRSLALALPVTFALPATFALLATMCTATPPPAAPAHAASSALASDAEAPSWVVPGIPITRPRPIILLQQPVAGPDAGAIRRIVPDPAPLVEQGQWVYDLRYEQGDVTLGGVHRTMLGAARATPRVMGRFALELYSGPTLIERVRFDFPGLGGAERAPTASPDGGKRQPLHGANFSFTAKLKTRVGVMLPATTRGTRLELWDRATDRRWPLPWPAVETTVDVVDEVDAAS